MQSRKELAEAGRRKLEEFRKAKAQGKAATTTPPSKPIQDAAAQLPPSSNVATESLANGGGTGYPPSSTPAAGAGALTPCPPADPASQRPHHSAPNGGPAVTSSLPSARPWEYQPPAPPPAPIASPTSGPASSPPSAPITTFVVLADAPIPFGAPAWAPTGQVSRTSSSGLAWATTNGATASSPGGGAAWNCGPSQPQAQPPSSDPASGWPWDPRPGGAAESPAANTSTQYANTGPCGGAGAGDATAASNGGGSFVDSWGKDQGGSTASQPMVPAAVSSSSVAGTAILFGESAGRSGSSSTAPPAAPHLCPPSALGGGAELHGPYGRGAGLGAAATNTNVFPSSTPLSRGAAAESWLPPGAAPSQPSNERTEPHGQPVTALVDSTAAAALGASLGVTATEPEASTPSHGQWSLPGPYSWQPAQPPAAAGPAAVVEAAEVTRPSWLSYSAAAVAAPTATTALHEQTGAAAAVAADGPGWLPAPGPVSTSTTAREAAQDPAPGSGPGGLTADGADAAGADAAAAPLPVSAAGGSAVTCYGHLSDSYVDGGRGGGGDDALTGPGVAEVAGALGATSAPAAASSTASPPPASSSAATAAPPPVAAPQPQPWDQGAATMLHYGGASPALPVSGTISTAVSPGEDVAGSYGVHEAPAPSAAPAPAPSRFAWLFGTPPPSRQPAPEEPSAASAMPWAGQPCPPSPPPPPGPVLAPPAGEEYGFAPSTSRPPAPDTATAGGAAGAWASTSAAPEGATHDHLPPPPPPPQNISVLSTTHPASQQQQQHLRPSSHVAGGQRAGYADGEGPGGPQWQSGRAGTAGLYSQQYVYAADVGPSGGSVPSLMGRSDGLGSLSSTAAPAAAPPTAAGTPWGAAGAAAAFPSEPGPGLGAAALPAGGGPYGSAAADGGASSGAAVDGIGRDVLYGGSGGAAAGLFGRDAGGPVLPSFLRGVEPVGPAAGRELFDRSGPAASATSAPWPPLALPGGRVGTLGGGLLGGLSRDAALTAPSSSSSAATAGAVQSLPSFTTSFPPLAPASGALASLQPLPHAALAVAAHAPPPPASSTLHPGPATTSAPHFSAAATYLSAYTAGGAGASSHGAQAPPAAAAATTTAPSFLESYLDNLLATMSAPKDGAEGTGARPGSAAGVTPSRSGGPGDSAVGTPRHSSLGDTPGDAVGAHAAGEGSEDVSGGGVGGDRAPGASDVPAGAGIGVLEGAGGSGRGVGAGLAHVDSSAQLRSHHSRRVSSDSVGVLSVYSHATGLTPAAGFGGAHPGGHGSGGSRAQFSALQQHIDELTEEKLTLSRGLQQQTRINEQLAEESEELMRQYNARGAAMEELQRKIKQYEQELEAQALSLEGCSEERQAARSSYAEASSRAQGLAAEVVGLEAQVLQLKSSVLKAQRAEEEAQQRAKKLEKQVETLSREAQDRAQELQQTQLKGRNLVVKLKQTETKLQAAEEKLAQQAALMAAAGSHGLANGHPPPPPPPPPKPTAEQEVQCELEAELAAAAAANGGQAGGAGHEDAAMAPAEGAVQGSSAAADAASVSSGAGSGGLGSQQLALTRQPSGPHSDALDAPDYTARAAAVDWEAARPQRDAPSAVVAERALASLDNRALRAGGGVLPEGLDAVALQLARWLPAGPVSGGDPVAVMVEEELRLMQSIHELLGGFEQAQEGSAAQMAELRAHVESLSHENEELRQKLELQTQRLELQMQGLHCGQPLSLHQTPALAGAVVEGGSVAAVVTPISGHSGYQHAPPEAEFAVVTPTRSTRGNPGGALDGPGLGGSGGMVAQPAKQTWMGYLFRPRQKKRTRSALI